MAIAMGKKGTRLDWSQFDALCLNRLERIIDHRNLSRSEQLSSRDLLALGFADAANAAHAWSTLGGH